MKIKTVSAIIAYALLSAGTCCLAQQASPPARERVDLRTIAEATGAIVIAEGRVVAEEHRGEAWLVLYGKDARTYVLHGELLNKIDSLRKELGEKNLIRFKGFDDKKGSVECRNKQEPNEEGKLFAKSTCLRFHGFEVIEIIEAKISDEIMPPAEQDLREEKLAQERLQKGIAAPQALIQRQGVVKSVSIRTPIQFFEIEFKDKDGAMISETILINNQTRFAKKLPASQEAVFAGINSLNKGQTVTVVYAQKDGKNTAQFVTITKE